MNKINIGVKHFFKDKFLSITIPAYNEEDNIELAVMDAAKALRSITNKYEILVINDGSTDHTAQKLQKLRKRYNNLRVITFEKNKGVGEALHTIYNNVRGDYIFLNAADNQVHMDELYRLLPYAMTNDIVVGNRTNRADSQIRRIVAKIFSTVIRLRFGVKVKDIDSCKIYKTSIFKKIKLQSHTAFIETEIFIRSTKAGLKIVEVPIQHYPRLKGKAKGIKLRIIIPQLWQMFKAIFKKW